MLGGLKLHCSLHLQRVIESEGLSRTTSFCGGTAGSFVGFWWVTLNVPRQNRCVDSEVGGVEVLHRHNNVAGDQPAWDHKLVTQTSVILYRQVGGIFIFSPF